ncbi:unnamed protein product [Lota lota]
MSSSGPSDSSCQPSSTSSMESSGGEEDGVNTEVGLLYPMARPAILAQRLLRVPLHSCHRHAGATPHRRKREMTPAEKKDTIYWDKRLKNNEAAKRSREKRRLNDMMMEGELLSLSDENAQLRAEVLALQYHLSLGRGPNKASAGSVPAGLCLPHRPQAPYLYPASTLFQAGGMWGPGGRDSPKALMLGMEQHEIASYHLGSGWPPLAPDVALAKASGDLPRSQGGYKQELLQFLPFACTPSPGKGEPGSTTGQTWTKRSDAPQLQVSSSGNRPGTSTHHISSSTLLPIPAFSPTSTSSTTSMTCPESWLIPPLHHPAWQNKPMVPWGSGYLSHPALYPHLPLYMAMEYGGERPPAGEAASGSRNFCSPHD